MPPRTRIEIGIVNNMPDAAETNWLGPALLVSEEAAIHIAVQGMEINLASDRYGASPQLVRMRLNVTGATIRVARRRVA